MSFEIDKYRNKISSVCSLYNVNKLYIFGSAITDEYNYKSDVDLLVDFKNININNYADNYYDFKIELQKIFNRKIDLLELQAIKNPYFKSEIEQTKRLIYG
jgi:predicted nucleotidyltransferase